MQEKQFTLKSDYLY